MLDLSRGEGPLSALLGGRGFSATFLKILAVICMTLDHVGLCFYWLPYAALFRQIGRIAFPLFAYTVGESIRHTRHPRRYFLCLLIPGIVMQAIYTGVMGSFDGNVFLTLCFPTSWSCFFAGGGCTAFGRFRLPSFWWAARCTSPISLSLF